MTFSFDISSLNNFNLPFNYGDNIENHILLDIENNKINISSNSEFFKFVKIIQPPNIKDIDFNSFTPFIKLKKEIDNRNVHFIYLIIWDKDIINKEKYVKLQRKFDISIVLISKKDIEKYYHISNLRCGFIMFLDDNNKVRFANSPTSDKIMKEIIINELQLKKPL
jgi:hypothetical protein